ncbi:hypothetical protein [Streptomyces albus]|uniref:hypothetical protein n=1 Tax=Streptomyces albus TaxID=1888 RepID=UPI0024E150C3|nr:hypothetical protein [Streptomyces albus]GHJ23269.1 hypothetical protein TPA0909_48830 [Streptomyces albus]
MSEGDGTDPGQVLLAAGLAYRTRMDYDWTTLRAHPQEMDLLATKLGWLADQVAGRIHHISEILNSLHLQWQGESAEEQKDISDRWLRVFSALFGTKDHPETGVLNALVGGVQKAAGNFGQADDHAWKMFNDYHMALTAPPMDQIIAGTAMIGSADPEATYQSVLDQLHKQPEDQMNTDRTAVTADYPGDDGTALQQTKHSDKDG